MKDIDILWALNIPWLWESVQQETVRSEFVTMQCHTKTTLPRGSLEKGPFSRPLQLRPRPVSSKTKQCLLNMSQCWSKVKERTTTTFFVFCQLLPLTCLIETICNHHPHHFFWFISTALLLYTSPHLGSSQMCQSKSWSTIHVIFWISINLLSSSGLL